MVCSRSGLLALENAGDRSLVVCNEATGYGRLNHVLRREIVTGLLNLANCRPTGAPTVHFLLLIWAARGMEIRRGVGVSCVVVY